MYFIWLTIALKQSFFRIFLRKKDLEILFEDNHLIAINKTNNLLVQVDTTGDEALEDMVKGYLKEKYNKPGSVYLGVCHRIDRPVSGLVLFAKTSKALARLNKMFQSKDVKKTYWAMVKNRPNPSEGTLVHYIERNSKKNKSVAHNKEVPNSKRGELSYQLIKSSDNYHLVEIDLKTGRHHQIRAQLSKIGCPIKGDLKYGFDRSNPDGGISLHSRSISFNHPVTKEEITIIAPVPNETLWQYFGNS